MITSARSNRARAGWRGRLPHMRPSVRAILLLALLAALSAGLSACSDAYVANRDDQRTPSVPPAPWEGNPLNMPQPGQRQY